MQLIRDNWNKVPLKTFREIEEALKDDSEIGKGVGVVAALMNTTPEQVLQYPHLDFLELMNASQFLNDFPTRPVLPSYLIRGERYTLDTNVAHFSTSQYIDFVQLVKDTDKNAPLLLACLLVPQGKKYAEGYDVAEVAKDIEEYLPFPDAVGIIDFFAHRLIGSIKIMLFSPIRRLKMKMRKAKGAEKIRIGRAIVTLSRLGGGGFISSTK